MSWITVFIILIAFGCYIVIQGMKNFNLRNLNQSIQRKDWETAHKLAQMNTTKKSVGEFTCDLYDLRAYYLSGDMTGFKAKIEEMTAKTYPENQDTQTYIEQYYHRFLIRGDREHAAFMLDKIKNTKDDKFIAYNEQAFKVMLDKSSEFIQPMIDEINSKKYYGFPLGVLLFMLAKQYEYIGDTQNADVYYENARVCFHPKAIYIPLIKEHISKNQTN